MIEKIIRTAWQGEGAGASVRRAIGTHKLPDLDPFLMLDFFKVKLPDGFPDHPHRGFETVTYMLKGSVKHEDFGGNAGEIGPGDVQWMTAGRGIVHAEMPGSYEEESLGFQLWVNLPQNKKMIQPHYQELKKEELPLYKDEKLEVVVISGKYKDVLGKVIPDSTSNFYDIHLDTGAIFKQRIPQGWKGLIYPYFTDKIQINDKILEKDEVAVLIGGDDVVVKNISQSEKVNFILIYGKPMDEPITKHGPFVMNTQEEIFQTFEDYQMAKNGFEKRLNWRSKISKLNQSF